MKLTIKIPYANVFILIRRAHKRKRKYKRPLRCICTNFVCTSFSSVSRHYVFVFVFSAVDVAIKYTCVCSVLFEICKIVDDNNNNSNNSRSDRKKLYDDCNFKRCRWARKRNGLVIFINFLCESEKWSGTKGIQIARDLKIDVCE